MKKSPSGEGGEDLVRILLNTEYNLYDQKQGLTDRQNHAIIDMRAYRRTVGGDSGSRKGVNVV